MSDLALEVIGLVSGYGRVSVLRELTLAIGKDEDVGLIGPNGHGKTTFFRAISGLIPAWSGSIRFLGEDVTNMPPAQIVQRGLIHVPQGNRLFPDMTVLENLSLGAFAPRARAERKRTIDKVFTLFPQLKERHAQKCRTLSGGERQMVAIGCGLMGQPKLLVLDEPTLGLSPKLKGELQKAIGGIIDSGVRTIIVEQDPKFLQTLTSRLLLIDEGRVRADIAASSSIERHRIMEMYFGIA